MWPTLKLAHTNYEYCKCMIESVWGYAVTCFLVTWQPATASMHGYINLGRALTLLAIAFQVLGEIIREYFYL